MTLKTIPYVYTYKNVRLLKSAWKALGASLALLCGLAAVLTFYK